MKLLIKRAILNEPLHTTCFSKKFIERDIFIEGNKIKKIGKNLNLRAKEKIDARGEKAVLPGLINCHTHSAMVLFRGYADDLPLDIWLKEKIWPLEARLTEDDVYWGTKLAILEMIKSGTTCFNEMYWFERAQIEAVREMKIRAIIGLVLLDFLPMGKREKIEKLYPELKAQRIKTIKLSLAPHSIYTVSKKSLIWAKNFAKKENLLLHLHLSETEKEVKDCLKKNKIRPVEYLEKIGFLDKNCVLAHSVWLTDKEIEVLAKRKCSLVYNPCSNMKLASGIFPYQKIKKAKINICLGTDGAASNNNLDMFKEMKFASLLQKVKEKDPTIAPAKEIFDLATKNGAKALKIKAGEIKEGYLADLILVDLNKISLLPNYNLISNVVYSATGDCVVDVICNGEILMREKIIEDEKEILKKVNLITKK